METAYRTSSNCLLKWRVWYWTFNYTLITWNQRLFTILLSRNNGSTQKAPNVQDRKRCIHDHRDFPVLEEWPNNTVSRYFNSGRTPYSKTKRLHPNTPPFSAQHCKVLFRTLGSLQRRIKYTQQNPQILKTFLNTVAMQITTKWPTTYSSRTEAFDVSRCKSLRLGVLIFLFGDVCTAFSLIFLSR